MSWTSNGFFRNVNIVKSIAVGDVDPIAIYQPGILNARSMAPDVRYSGFVTSLRATVDLTSIPEIVFPTPEIGMSEGELNALMRTVEQGSQKKQLDLLIQSSNSDQVQIGSISLFNRRPYYTVDLLLYYTDAAAFDVASDALLSCRVRDVGYGGLLGGDRIALYGSAVEEAENTAPSLNVSSDY